MASVNISMIADPTVRAQAEAEMKRCTSMMGSPTTMSKGTACLSEFAKNFGRYLSPGTAAQTVPSFTTPTMIASEVTQQTTTPPNRPFLQTPMGKIAVIGGGLALVGLVGAVVVKKRRARRSAGGSGVHGLGCTCGCGLSGTRKRRGHKSRGLSGCNCTC